MAVATIKRPTKMAMAMAMAMQAAASMPIDTLMVSFFSFPNTLTHTDKLLLLYLVHFNAERTYSLPRTAAGAGPQAQRYSQQPSYNEGYYTQDRRRNNSRSHQQMDDASSNPMDKPDFYFMPSQRKYSGEVVRVYVDYNKDVKK